MSADFWIILACVILGLLIGFLGYVYVSYLNHKDARNYNQWVSEEEKKNAQKLSRRVRRSIESKVLKKQK